MSKLTDKQLMFCQEYIIDLNATQAAIRAGYSEATAYSIGHENLSKPEIEAKIQECMELRAKRTEITADRVLAELSKIGFADVRDLFTSAGGLRNPDQLDDDIAAALQSVEVVTRISGEEDEYGNKIVDHVHKVRLNDKKAALELMGKHLKLFTDKIEGKYEGGLKVEIVKFGDDTDTE